MTTHISICDEKVKNKKKDYIMKKVKNFLMMCVIVLSAFSLLQFYMNSESVTASIQNIDGTTVVTDVGVFNNDVNLLRGKTSGDVSDVRRTLAYRGTYKLNVYGFNIPLLNMKQNILSVERVRVVYQPKDENTLTSKILKTAANFAVKSTGVDVLGDLISGIN